MTAVQTRAFAEACYPADVTAFLDAQGYERLHAGDVERALAISATTAPAPTAREATPTTVRRPGKTVTRRPSGRVRIAVLLMAGLAGGLILAAAFRTGQPESARPLASATDLKRSPAPTTAPGESVCLHLLRASATSWCETALTGIVARDGPSQAKLGECGDRLAAGRDTVRLALDRLLSDQATDTYTPADARERCAAAAKLALPR